MSSPNWPSKMFKKAGATVTSTTTNYTLPTSAADNFSIQMPAFFINKDGVVRSKPKVATPDYLSYEQLVYYPRENKAYDGNSAEQGPGNLAFINVRELLARFFVGVHFQMERISNWRTKCIGITSMIKPYDEGPGGHHMPMFDYDGNVKKKIRADVARLQSEHGLGDAWVYRTKRGYHVYFFCDQVPWKEYMQFVEEADCCSGFKKQTARNGFSVLRVSAKYTQFDIELEYILQRQNTSVLKRPLRKAHLIQELISQGQQCGTHLASLYPQWARFREDPKEWRASAKAKTRRVRRKSPRNEVERVQDLKSELRLASDRLYKDMVVKEDKFY